MTPESRLDDRGLCRTAASRRNRRENTTSHPRGAPHGEQVPVRRPGDSPALKHILRWISWTRSPGICSVGRRHRRRRPRSPVGVSLREYLRGLRPLTLSPSDRSGQLRRAWRVRQERPEETGKNVLPPRRGRFDTFGHRHRRDLRTARLAGTNSVPDHRGESSHRAELRAPKSARRIEKHTVSRSTPYREAHPIDPRSHLARVGCSDPGPGGFRLPRSLPPHETPTTARETSTRSHPTEEPSPMLRLEWFWLGWVWLRELGIGKFRLGERR